ncbi:MAG: helix-turn-helix domain-containing protein [Egibacteraceae bacterium]
MTAPLQRVLLLFLQDPPKRRYGLEIAREADLQRGTLYPMLARLEERRWVTQVRDGNRSWRWPERRAGRAASAGCTARCWRSALPLPAWTRSEAP